MPRGEVVRPRGEAVRWREPRSQGETARGIVLKSDTVRRGGLWEQTAQCRYGVEWSSVMQCIVMYVCMYACMYVCIDIDIDVRVRARARVRAR